MNIGLVKPHSVTFTEPLVLESGKTLAPVTLAYETYGELDGHRDNAILVLHAFSGDAHAAGYHDGDDRPGWWDAMIGPGKAFDTDRYFVICSNVIGGCAGSTGPSSIDPATGKAYGLDFPVVTIADMVNAQKRLIDHLGIDRLLCVAGGSMGGMQVLQWVASCPERVRSAVPIATAMKHSPQQIAFGEVGRQAIMADPDWQQGRYYDDGRCPRRGLAVARMLGHITYMSERSMEEKFSRSANPCEYTFSFTAEFEVEKYLRYRGDAFVRRFDADSYLYITKAMDYFDVSDGRLFTRDDVPIPRFLVVSFPSDWLYPSSQSLELVRQIKRHHGDVSYCEVASTYGHDAFLLEVSEQTRLIRPFLDRVRRGGLS
jgi:homoserine O-acetyltransferase